MSVGQRVRIAARPSDLERKYQHTYTGHHGTVTHVRDGYSNVKIDNYPEFSFSHSQLQPLT